MLEKNCYLACTPKMNKALKNPLKKDIKGHFRGRDISFPARKSQIFDVDTEEGKKLYQYWKETFAFIYDVPIKGGETTT